MKEFLVKDFSLEHTLNSGQLFLFEKIEDYFYIVNRDIIFKVKQEKNIIYYDGILEDELRYFFSLDEDLNEIMVDVEDKYLLNAMEQYWGLRHMRQDLWQTMIGFICSSASNIPKIKMNLKLLSEFFGKSTQFDDKTFFLFPKPGSIDDLDNIIKSKTGFRGKYIYKLNEILKQNPDLLDEIKAANYKDAKTMLMKLPGIGPKVADCIRLFSLGHKDAFPIDTWITQIIEKLYIGRETKNMKELEQFVESHFKSNKGIKQQYLFHWAKENLKN